VSLRLKELFPNNITFTNRPRSTRSILVVDNSFLTTILFCGTEHREEGQLRWVVEPLVTEREYVTLLCTLNHTHDQILDYYLFPRIPWKSHLLSRDDPALRLATKLSNLSDFYTAVKAIHSEMLGGKRPGLALPVADPASINSRNA
jgi:hypothetical protein